MDGLGSACAAGGPEWCSPEGLCFRPPLSTHENKPGQEEVPDQCPGQKQQQRNSLTPVESLCCRLTLISLRLTAFSIFLLLFVLGIRALGVKVGLELVN